VIVGGRTLAGSSNLYSAASDPGGKGEGLLFQLATHLRGGGGGGVIKGGEKKFYHFLLIRPLTDRSVIMAGGGLIDTGPQS